MPVLLPEVITFGPPEITRYQQGLADNGLRPDSLPFAIPYSSPIVIPETLAKEMLQASHEWWDAHMTLSAEAGGITEWVAPHAPTITRKNGSKVTLNNPAINKQLEDRLGSDDGWNTSFMAYDCMVVQEPDGTPGLNIIEVQSLACYAGWMEIIGDVRGDDGLPFNRYIETPPSDALGLLKRHADGPITVMDMNHQASSSITHADKVLAAKTLGGEGAEPITPLQIQKDKDGWYAKQSDGTVQRITNVHSRLFQEDLDEMSDIADPAQLELLIEFFNDPSINWLHHPTWQYIVNKSTIPTVAQSDIEGTFRKHLVEAYAQGETITKPGPYVIKPIGGNSGHGQMQVRVHEGESFVVPDGFIGQKRFTPMPIPVEYPGGEAEKLPIGVRYGALEVRIMYPPQPKGQEPNAVFMTRFAPYHPTPEDTHNVTPTNVGKILGAMVAHGAVALRDQSQLPFGMGPALIDTSR